ncbi:Tryptophan--tRNA ligase 2 [compost metagenome]
MPQVADECRSAGIGCVQCKRRLADSLNATLAPIRERREAFAQTPGLLETILQEGKEKASVVARETMAEVREAMKLNVLTPAFAENPR